VHARPGVKSGLGDDKNSLITTIKRKVKINNKISFSLALGIVVLTVVLFFTSSVTSSGMTSEEEFVLPKDSSIETLLYSYTEPEKTYAGQRDIKPPQQSILSSVKPASYSVKKGDTLSEISQRYDVKLGTLLSFNNIQDVRKIKVGMELKIPEIDGVLYTVQKGDSLSVISYRHGVSLNAILDANGLESSVIKPGQELFIPGASISEFELRKATGRLFIYPSAGTLTSPYGMRIDPFTGVWRMHYGYDIANHIGTDVKAAMEGKVVSVGINYKGFGKYVILNHKAGFQTLYAHLNNAVVSKGEWVSQGEKIGEIGNTGRSTGPHLHFGIYRFQKPIDPQKYLY
jgi:murein DD-endopeptidase MepM/ murein hydrolase activator NlpD